MAGQQTQFTFASAGTQANVVPALSGRSIVVNSVLVTAAAATTLDFQSATTSSKHTGAHNMQAGLTILPENEDGWFQTQNGEGLTLVASAACTVSFTWSVTP